ncbi:DUF2147 domain-containing protein [Sphingomonas sp.]|uniref:DUF2147 domain-containing protein n=1 Tax=Sphingomonas sp. TaxID=28214 RepID=UPI001EB77B05|nr:DUF2147 domain-containing protein [Sphingomonas sp.]MBX3593200.1 DUF2147 domain-containing protein [Sphingomonas sp.]
MRKAIIATLIATSAAPALGAVQTQGLTEGVWMNPYRSVAVRTGPCGDRICGWIVWASASAQADARSSGIDRLIGVQLLEDYRPQGPNHWTGTVFVPDMNRRFASEINALSPTSLQIKGCILHGLICRSQTWNRIERLPQ